MTDYISRQAAIEACDKALRTIDAKYLIKKEPASDVVEVVRCKDCRYWNNKVDLTYCEKKTWLGTDADDFCSFGEKADK